MRKNFFTFFVLTTLCCNACTVDDIVVTYNGKSASVEKNSEDSVDVKVDGSHVIIDSKYKAKELKVRLTGKSEDGTLKLETNGKARVELDGISLTSNEGAPLWLKNKKRVEVVACDGKENTLTITACKDTANNKAAVIWAKDKVHFSGKGTLNANATGDGCKGINAKDDIKISELTLNVVATGNNLGVDNRGFGGFGGPGMGPGGFNFDELPDSVKQQMEEMRKHFEEMMKNGDFPQMGGPGGFPGSPDGGFGGPGGFGGFGGPGGFGGFGGFGGGASGDPDRGDFPGGKQKYIGSTKAIKSAGQVIINSGKVFAKSTAAGGEGIEGKKGVIINGGEVTVDAVDDAINANDRIFFNGGKVIAESRNNDAVDANYGDGMMGFGPPPFMMGGFGNNKENKANDKKKEDPIPAIVINGGEIYPWSHTGSPEEGLDCDFYPIEISGGTVFSIGGGMGEMPSVPSEKTAKQPTILLLNMTIVKNETINIYESDENGKAKGKPFKTITAPFTFNNSASLVSCAEFKKGKTYTVETKDYKKTFTLKENFTTVR